MSASVGSGDPLPLPDPAGGLWWPASDPGSRYIGSVTSRGGGPTLTLLAEADGGPLPILWLGPERTWHGEIAGWGGAAVKVTLIDCRRLSGPQPLTLTARLGVSGESHLDPDAAELSLVQLRVPGLLDWVSLRSRVRRPRARTKRQPGALRVEEYLGPQMWRAPMPDHGVVEVRCELPESEPWMAPSPGDPNLVDFDAPETVIVTFRPVVPFSLADVVALCDPFSWLASLAHARSLKAQPVAVGTDEARWVLLRSSDEPFPGNNLASFEDPVRPPFYINGESDFASTLEAWFRLAGSSRLALATLFEGAMDPASSPRRRVSEAAGALERLDQTALGGHPDAALEARIASAFRRFPAAEWPSRPGDFSGEPLSGKLLRKRSRLLALKRHDVAHANIPERAGELDDRLAAATLAHLCKLVLVEQLGVAQDDAAEKMKAHFEWELVL